jgi:hypothetical protein
METFANRADANKDHSQPAIFAILGRIRKEPLLIIAVNVAQQLAKFFIDECFDHKLGRAKQLRRCIIFRFLNL